ncbi:putative phage baseplate assembly protein [Blastococcus colisei]|uniref:Putative phage baseplate assembly protein n=1 Tax=Blastococcus colisei TaxID=1564162 RepID=A0A543PFP5_9ACTN|nr:putative baseplate assembly protein [Blastococcus colisei]TQN42903.1 putative phage baseplate assembly protein [Blastococcus colisei]
MTDPDLVCGGDRRRPLLRASERTNGIDYVEVERVDDKLDLHLFLLRSLPQGDDGPLFGAENVLVTRDDGGDPLVVAEDPRWLPAPDPARDDAAVVTVDDPGDRGRYTLRLVDTPDRPLEDIDPRYRTATFSLAAGTPIDVDCLPAPMCPSTELPTPELSYLAKDYASFRQLLLDRLATTLPGWQERHAADLYLTLVEVLAYEADRLSYAQDAVGTEAYLDTARLRTSVRRHARLVDYAMHEGCNARAWVHLTVEGDPGVAADALSFVTRPAGIDVRSASLPSHLLARAPRRTYEVFEPVLPEGPAGVTAQDVVEPRALVDRIRHGDDPVLDHVRTTLSDDERRLFDRGDPGDEDLPALLGAVAARLAGLLQDPALVHRAPGAVARAVRRHGTVNALSGARLARHNRAELARLFPEELADPTALRFHEAHNEIRFHTWGLTECCLPAGATSATLRDGEDGGRVLRHLRPGDVLVLEEVLGPRSGSRADADPSHRHPVRLTAVRPGRDALADVPVVEVAWDPEDALPFPLVLSAIGPAPECALVGDVTVARGNVVLVDHGETVRAPDPVVLRDGGRTIVAVPFPPPHEVVPAASVDLCCTCEGAPAEGPARVPAYEPVLDRQPLVFRAPLAPGTSARATVTQDPRRALPALTVFGPVTGTNPWEDVVEREQDAAMARPGTVRYGRWRVRRDLLSSGSEDRHVVVEVDDDRVAHLRFGDDQLGARPTPGIRMLAAYRTGGGVAGNVGQGAIRHVVARAQPRGGRIVGVRNPLAAGGGTDPEQVDEVRLRAPHAFRVQLERAVVAEDYAAIVARDFPEVQRAVATVTVRPPRTVITVLVDPVGTTAETVEMRQRIHGHLERYRRIGHIVEVTTAVYVPVDLALDVIVLPGHQPGAVRAALRDRLSDRRLRDGSLGLFHPDALTFGRPVAISQVLAVVHRVPGVASGRVTKLARTAGGDPLPADDVLRIEAHEVVRLDADPDRPENGSLTIHLEVVP